VTWTKAELATILGPAMDEFEREQSARERSVIPLRGLCLVAYFTLMRPRNNLALAWHEVDRPRRGYFSLDDHKNVNKGIRAEGPLAEQLARYLDSIRPSNASGLVHFNPANGRQYVDIRKQWRRLVEIASDMLGYKLTDRKADFFTFRHTGASHLAEKTSNPILIVKMMGDTNVQTVMRHYFNLDLAFMAEMVSGWEVPKLEGRERRESEWTEN
jgi:integrase